MTKELNQHMSQTGNPFERTMLMLEIDKRDVEIASLKEHIEMYDKTIKSMAEALQVCSENLFKILKYDDADWNELKFILDKYGVIYSEDSFSKFALALPEFVRWKFGRSTDEKP